MKKVIDRQTGFVVKTTNNSLIIEFPLKQLVSLFENDPYNENQFGIMRGLKRDFLDWVSKKVLEECDSEDGTNYIQAMFSAVFKNIFDGYEYDNFVKDNDYE